MSSDLLFVFLWAIALRLVVAAFTANTYDPDEFVILGLSRDFSHGEIPYRDFMFFHPPGVLVLFRVLQPLTTWWWPAGRLFMLLVDSATAVLVFRIGTVIYGRRQALAAAVLYGASPLALICAVRIQQDTLITFLGVAGLSLLVSDRSRRNAILAGACLGLAVWIKYPALLFLPIYVLAAPRRTLFTVSAAMAAAALAFAPFLHELPALYNQTVVWQTLLRRPTDGWQRFATVGAFWLLVNPLAFLALRRQRPPAWLLCGFGMGGIFLLAPQTYYHYFVPVVPFAALLAAPAIGNYVWRTRTLIAAAAIVFAAIWAIDISMGSDPERLFISASRFSAIHRTVQLIDRTTEPGQRVLTDQLEYAYLARRRPVADYFWNMRGVINARYLEYRLADVGAVVLTERVAPTYPPGFIQFLDTHRYIKVQTGAAEVWLICRPLHDGTRSGTISLSRNWKKLVGQLARYCDPLPGRSPENLREERL